MFDEKTDGYEELTHEGALRLYTRNGIFQARVYIGARRYLTKSLKTRKLEEARKAADYFWYEIQIKKDNNLPIKGRRFSEVIAEYLKLRKTQNQRGLKKSPDRRSQEYTSDQNLRQMVRVSKFWLEYCGGKSVETIDNAVLTDYVSWRRDYYSKIPEKDRPRNYSLHPADKTLEWETVFALTLLKYAHERGYRGAKQMPDYYYKASKTMTRPAFTLDEYRRLYKGMRKWMYEEKKNEARRYTRELLRDYVLILSNSGIRVGEANNLRESDLVKFTDGLGRQNYRFVVNGKTGKREVVLRVNAVRYVDRCLERNALWRERWERNASAGLKTHNRKAAKAGDWLFRMADGNQVISLGDQFQKVLAREKITHNVDGEAFSLYCLRHFYAVQMLRRGKATIWDISENMGADVGIIKKHYGRSAKSALLADRLG
jgi:site-specific recombinase XerD